MNRRELLKTSSLILGYAVTGGTAIAVMNGCRADTSPNWTPVNLGKEEYKLVSALAEFIIPSTDTPGAIEAGVDRFVDAVLESFDESEKEEYLSSLARIQELSDEKAGKSFNRCSDDEKHMIFESMISGSNDDKKAFRKIRETVVVGYCISEAGATQLLNYDPIPGAPYKGCVDFSEVGKTWALDSDR